MKVCFDPRFAWNREEIPSPRYTVRLHRVLTTTPEKVYRAFLDPDALARWLPRTASRARSTPIADARVGGKYKMSFTNFTTQKSESFGGEYRELVPNERIVYTDRFDDPNLPGEIVVTVTLKEGLRGTELNIEQAGIPEVIPLAGCYLGWQESLLNLARLVEPDIDM